MNICVFDQGPGRPGPGFSNWVMDTSAIDSLAVSIERSSLRPASARRMQNMHLLLSEFRQREMGTLGVALLLDCSISRARGYLNELIEHDVIVANPAKPAWPYLDKKVYHLTTSSFHLNTYVAWLWAALRVTPRPIGAGRHGHVAGLPEAGAASQLPGLVTARDPLVAALFGSGAPPG
jgi:hypothetical protein